MAEVVQSHIEEMLPEVYELQQLGVLSPAEAKAVIKTRTDFEYKMRRRISKKQDFLRFIDYELKLEKLKQARISHLGLNDVSEGARYRSLQRIHFLFQKCLRKYTNDVPLWLRYIKYCKQVSSTRSLGLAFVEALKHNPQCIVLWIMSAKNEMESNKNVSAARSIFLQALKFNSESVDLWTEYFRLEVLHVEKLQKRQQIMQACDKPSNLRSTNDFMSFKTAKIVFKNATNSIELSSKNLSGFSEITNKLEHGDDLTKFLYETALRKYPNNSSLWVSLAEFVLTNDKAKAISILQTALKTIKTLDCLTEVINFVITFKEKIGDIHSLMLDFMAKDFNEFTVFDPDLVIRLGEMLVTNNLDVLLPSLYKVALNKYPKSKALWLFKIQNFSDNPMDDIESALAALHNDPDIWSQYLKCLSLTDLVQCREKWDEVIKESFSAPLLTDYLEFVYTSSGLLEVRKVFQEIKNWHTLPESAITAVLKYEIANLTDVEVVCNTYSLLTTNFSAIKNWQSYLEFCQTNCPEKISSVVWKCKNYLSEAEIASLLY